MKAEIVFINIIAKENFFTGVENNVKIVLFILLAVFLTVLLNYLVHQVSKRYLEIQVLSYNVF